MHSLTITIVTSDVSEQWAWSLALRALGATIQVRPIEAPVSEHAPDCYVVVVPPLLPSALVHACVSQLSARTLLVCDDLNRAWELSSQIAYPTVITSMRLARTFLPNQLRLLLDLTSGQIAYTGPGRVVASTSVQPDTRRVRY